MMLPRQTSVIDQFFKPKHFIVSYLVSTFLFMSHMSHGTNYIVVPTKL